MHFHDGHKPHVMHLEHRTPRAPEPIVANGYARRAPQTQGDRVARLLFAAIGFRYRQPEAVCRHRTRTAPPEFNQILGSIEDLIATTARSLQSGADQSVVRIGAMHKPQQNIGVCEPGHQSSPSMLFAGVGRRWKHGKFKPVCSRIETC